VSAVFSPDARDGDPRGTGIEGQLGIAGRQKVEQALHVLHVRIGLKRPWLLFNGQHCNGERLFDQMQFASRDVRHDVVS
jgi:hypothetical protein